MSTSNPSSTEREVLTLKLGTPEIQTLIELLLCAPMGQHVASFCRYRVRSSERRSDLPKAARLCKWPLPDWKLAVSGSK